MFLYTAAAFKLAPIKSATNLQFSSGLFVNAKKVQFVLVKVPITRDKTAPAPDPWAVYTRLSDVSEA